MNSIQGFSAFFARCEEHIQLPRLALRHPATYCSMYCPPYVCIPAAESLLAITGGAVASGHKTYSA